MKSGFCNVKVNAPAGWRQKIGQLLVKLCQRVDRSRWYLAVDFDCSPAISADDQRTIIVMAWETMRTLARDTVRSALVENEMKGALPGLYQEEKSMQTCSHGLPLQVKCQQCTQEALSRPACYETYWIAGHGCKKPADRCEACAGCAYNTDGRRA